MTNASIYEVNKKHWGKRFYNLTFHYEYVLENKKFKGDFEAEEKVRNYSSKWIISDSIKIKYNLDNLGESKFIKRTFAKPRIN